MTAQMWAHGYLNQVSQAIAALSTEELAAATDLLLDTWRRQARVYVCGNGGSAAIASHFAGDLNKGANVAGRHRFRAAEFLEAPLRSGEGGRRPGRGRCGAGAAGEREAKESG